MRLKQPIGRYGCVRVWMVMISVLGFWLLPFQTTIAVFGAEPSQLQLFQALMAEDIFSNAPRNPTAVFSVEQKKAICYTSFNQVPQKLIIYHNWYHRDVPSAKIRLTLKPPSWSTYSSIELNQSDIGPWRVEITDESGNIIEVLRFSVTE